jgi:hypothetical protein
LLASGGCGDPGTPAFQHRRRHGGWSASDEGQRGAGAAERVYNRSRARTLADRVDGVPFQQLVSESEFLFNQFDGGVAFYSPQPFPDGLRYNLVAGAPSNEVWAQRPFAHELLTFLGQGAGPVFSPLVPDTPTSGVVLFIAVASARRNVIAIGALSPQQLGIPTL